MTRPNEVCTMTAAAVRSTSARIPTPRAAADDLPTPQPVSVPAAVAYQRVLHQLVRRELRLLGDLAAWAPTDDATRITELSRHAELIGAVVLHHHATEREAVWPALRRTAPATPELQAALDDWTARCARIDHMLRDVATAARQWGVAMTESARDTFAMACRAVADAVDAQTAAEERALLPLLGAHLRAEDWAAIAASSRCDLSARDQLMVLGLALEDACAADRARVLEGLPRSVRWVWRHGGERRYRAAVVRLRGEPPAA
jgi:Hemerythrin HHE cation binding domain